MVMSDGSRTPPIGVAEAILIGSAEIAQAKAQLARSVIKCN